MRVFSGVTRRNEQSKFYLLDLVHVPQAHSDLIGAAHSRIASPRTRSNALTVKSTHGQLVTNFLSHTRKSTTAVCACWKPRNSKRFRALQQAFGEGQCHQVPLLHGRVAAEHVPKVPNITASRHDPCRRVFGIPVWSFCAPFWLWRPCASGYDPNARHSGCINILDCEAKGTNAWYLRPWWWRNSNNNRPCPQAVQTTAKTWRWIFGYKKKDTWRVAPHFSAIKPFHVKEKKPKARRFNNGPKPCFQPPINRPFKPFWTFYKPKIRITLSSLKLDP